MSILTKIFVVALVVLSLLLSAATITFVNSIDDYKTAMVATDAKLTNQASHLAAVNAKALADRESLQRQADVANTAAAALTTQIATLTAQTADLGGQLARANSASTSSAADVNRLTAAVSASEATKSLFANQINELRTTLATLQTQNGDLNVAFSDASNKLNVTEEARRVLAEQLAENRTQLDRVGGALRDRGVDPERLRAGGLVAGAPAINGVIRTVRPIAGIPHATISVGSEDQVKLNMEFNILGANGQFLGKLTVVAVEPNAAVGRLSGPNVAAITPNSEVRTQL